MTGMAHESEIEDEHAMRSGLVYGLCVAAGEVVRLIRLSWLADCLEDSGRC